MDRDRFRRPVRVHAVTLLLLLATTLPLAVTGLGAGPRWETGAGAHGPAEQAPGDVAGRTDARRTPGQPRLVGVRAEEAARSKAETLARARAEALARTRAKERARAAARARATAEARRAAASAREVAAARARAAAATRVNVARAAQQRATAAKVRAAGTGASRSSTRGTAGSSPARYSGRNRMWYPALGVNQSVSWFPCSRSRAPDNYVYRWGCAGWNNVYLMAHAWGKFKPLNRAYYAGRLAKGQLLVYADNKGRVHYYRLAWWRTYPPLTTAAWAWAPQLRSSATLQTCVGPNSELRLFVRFREVSAP